MKAKKLKNLTKKLRSELTWATLERTHEAPGIRIFSDTKTQAHTIMLPASQEHPVPEMDYLHELGHALLCERVHPVFANNFYLGGKPSKEQFMALAPALNVAADWFIGAWLLDVCAESAREQIEQNLETAEKLLEKQQSPTPDVFLGAALMIAQAIKHLDEPIDCGGVLKQAVNAYLAVPPDKPSASRYEELVNRLLAIYSPYRTKIVHDGEYDVWEISEEQAAESAAAPAGAPS